MSISSEISRLQSAKAALATSISNKGVTVVPSATLDTYPSLVDSIQTSGGGSTQLYKTVTLSEAHTSDSIGNPVYWASFLELPLVNDSTDTCIYIVVFNGNTANQNYRTDFEVFYRQGSTIKAIDVRNNRSNVYTSYVTNRSSWASAGTVIKVYKIEQV